MGTPATLIVTGFDAQHFDLAQDFADSFRQAYQEQYQLAAVVFGPQAPPPQLSDRFDRITRLDASGPSFDAGRNGYFLAHAGVKARLRDIFPGYASYCWVDADCWFQGDESLPRILAGMPGFDLCIHPEFDVHYLNFPTPSERTLHIYRTNEAANLSAMPLRMPMVNSGVFAMRTDSRVWALWDAELTGLRQRHERGEAVFFCDQIALHKLVYLNQLRIYPLRAIDNWQTYACLPMIHRETRCLRVPTPPHEKIGVMHLAGRSKHQQLQIDGQTLTLRYRDMARLFAA